MCTSERNDMTDVVTIRTVDEMDQLKPGMEVVVIGDFLAYGSNTEYISDLTTGDEQYRIVKNCQLRLACGWSVTVALEDKALPVPTDDTLRYANNTDTPLSGRPVEREDKIAIIATVEVIAHPKSDQRSLYLRTNSSRLQPALLS